MREVKGHLNERIYTKEVCTRESSFLFSNNFFHIVTYTYMVGSMRSNLGITVFWLALLNIRVAARQDIVKKV